MELPSIPTEVSAFLLFLEEWAPALRPKVQSGGVKAGNWWIDLPDERETTIEWRPSLGFGVSYGDDDGYGDGPTEVFKTPELAARRVGQLLETKTDITVVLLRQIRELCGLTQEQLAEKLHVRQAAISKIEGRSDIKIETIGGYVEALGGHIEIRAVLPDGYLPIYTSRHSVSHRSEYINISSHGASQSRGITSA